MLDTSFKLNDGNTIPSIGLGTWNTKKKKELSSIQHAIEVAGYRHIDCASIYGNEKEIGEVFSKIIKNNKVSREELFITSKLWNTDHHPDNVLKACKRTLSDLNLEYLDLYLVHWTVAFQSGGELEPVDKDGNAKLVDVPMQETWKAMEELVEKGLVKSIGISNFNTQSVADLLTYAKIRPAVNQIEVHPYNSQQELFEYLRRLDIHVTAYSPIGSPSATDNDKPRLIDDKTIVEVAKKYGVTPAQTILSWNISRGISVIPKSTNNSRIKGNLKSIDLGLEKEDVKKINELNRNFRYVNPIDWWKIPYFA